QIQLVENAIASKFDAIILSAADSKALNPVIVKANEANIPVILVNDTIDEEALAADGGFVETYVGIDQYEAASLAGEYAANNLDGGKILLLEGPSGVDALQQRLDGFKDQVEGKEGFEIVSSQNANCDRNEGFGVMQNVMTSNPDVNIVWAVNAEMGQGAIQAIEQAGKTGTISVFDFDASDDDIEAIKEGTLVGSVAQYPGLQAEGAIQACLDVLSGKKLDPHTKTKAELITKDNVDTFGE
ncbi:sugar ABC transporter substrate-binding protein, partial [Globicatella sulfidifaciens]